jgi:hypothetical protein
MRPPVSCLQPTFGCLLFLLLAGCRDVSGPAASGDGPALARAEVSREVFTIDLDFTDEPPCTDEAVHWTGTVHVVIHEVANRGAPPPSAEGAQHFIVNLSFKLNGVGEESGAAYRLGSSAHTNIQSISPTEAFPTTFRDGFRDRIFGPDGLLGFARLRSKFVLNGNGRLVFELEEFTVRCR